MAHKVVVHHFHDGNDIEHNVRGTAQYATSAHVVNTETGEHLTDTYWSYCSPRDNPSRRLGRLIATSRLAKENPEYFLQMQCMVV